MVRLVVLVTCSLGLGGCTFDTSATGNGRDGQLPAIDATTSVIDAGQGDGSTSSEDAGDIPTVSYTRTIRINPPVLTQELDGFVVAILINADVGLRTHARNDGTDIAFKTMAGLPLFYEIESYDGNTGTLEAWVRLPSLPISGVEIAMHYGGLGPFTVQDATATWATTFAAVWHFSDDVLTPGVFPDSTGGGSTTAATVNIAVPASANGIAGGGLLFNGTTHSLHVPNSAAGPLNFATESFSYSTWVLVTTNKGMWDSPYHKGGSSPAMPGYAFELGTGDWAMAVSTSPPAGEEKTIAFGDGADLTGAWVHLVGVVDGPADQASAYLNGTFRGSTELLGSVSGANEATISRPSSGNFFQGSLDELRIYNVALSSDWIAAEYENLSSPASFLDVGPEVSLGN